MEKLTFIPLEKEDQFINTLKKEITPIFSAGDKVCIKLHMGTPGNNNFLNPDFVRKVADLMKSLELEVFLFDSPTMYPGARSTVEEYQKTAAMHGFSEETMACPVIISNKGTQVKMENITANVCENIYNADGLLVLTHVKGHACSGFGASIKNLGMGGVDKETKTEIHTRPRPFLKEGCIGCGMCVEVCPAGAITMENSKAKLNKDACWGCGACVTICVTDALVNEDASFDALLAQSGIAAMKNKNKIYCVNVMKKMAKLCDCVPDGGPIVIEDIGIVMGENIVAVDKAAFDIINKKAGKDLFASINHISPLGHIKEGAKASGLSMEYKLKNVS